VPALNKIFYALPAEDGLLENESGCGEKKGFGEKESPQPLPVGVPRLRRGTFQNQIFLIK